MLRKALTIPALAGLIVSGSAGLQAHRGVAHARSTAAAYSGTIAVTDNVFPDSTILGGAFGNSTTDANVGTLMIDGLFTYDNKGNFTPQDATTVPTQANGGIKVVNGNEVVTWHVKPNLKWSDGSPITPEDYIANIVFYLSPEYNQTLGIDQIKSITWSGNDMTITYKGIYAPAVAYATPSAFPYEFFQKKYGITVPAGALSSYDAAKFATLFSSSSWKGSPLQKLIVKWTSDAYNSPSDVFDGPYKLQEWTDQQRIVMVPNTFYSALPSDPHHPRPAKIQFVVVTLSGAQYAASMAASSTYNNIDEAEDFRLPDLPTLKQSKYQVKIGPALGYAHLELNQKNPALRDLRVRQALVDAINKTQFIQAVFTGIDPSIAKTVNLNSVLPPASPWSNNSSLPANAYNPSKARQLLSAAGYATNPGGSGKHLALSLSYFPNKINSRDAQLLQHYWAQVGVQVRLQTVTASGPNSLLASFQDGGILFRRNFDIVLFGFSTAPDPDQLIFNVEPGAIPDATHPTGENYAGMNDPKLVNYFLAARKTLDTTQRHKLYNDMQTYFYDQSYWIMLYYNPNMIAFKGTIGNFQLNPTQAGNYWNIAQWYRTTT